MDVEQGKLEEELIDKPGTTIGTKFFVLHCLRRPFSMICGFWPLINTAGVFSMAFIVKNIQFFDTVSCLFMRLHFSTGCYDTKITQCAWSMDVMEWVRTQTWAMRVHVIHFEKWTCEVWCSHTPSVAADYCQLKKNRHVWGFMKRRHSQQVSPFCHVALCMSSVADFLVDCHELHQESFHCHQDEELDDGCRCWCCQNGIGASCSSPDSQWRRCNVVNASLESEWCLLGPISRLIERDPPILFASKVLILRHSKSVIFLRILENLDTHFFTSIDFELRFTKCGIFLEAIVHPFKTSLDASLSQIMGNMMVSLLFSFPNEVAPFKMT